jgi:parvulin-like peptidyl-prolyl isomerase
MKVSHVIIALALASALILAGCGPKPVAKINGEAVTQAEFMKALQDGVGLVTGPATGRRVLDTLIVTRLVEKAAQEKGITISDKEIQTAREEFKSSVEASMRGETFESFMQQREMTEEYLADQLRFNILLQRLVVTDLEAEEFFKENAAQFDKPEQRTFYQIFLPTQEAAAAARKEVVEAGTDFIEVAKQRSMRTELYPLPPGGIPVTVPKGVSLGDPDPKFEEVLFSMKQGEVTQPLLLKLPVVRGREQGTDKLTVWRLIYLEAVIPAKKATLEDSLDEARMQVFSRKMARGQVTEYLSSLKAKARLDILDPRYSALAEEYQRLATEMPGPQIPQPQAPGQAPAPAPAPEEAPQTAPE